MNGVRTAEAKLTKRGSWFPRLVNSKGHPRGALVTDVDASAAFLRFGEAAPVEVIYNLQYIVT